MSKAMNTSTGTTKMAICRPEPKVSFRLKFIWFLIATYIATRCSATLPTGGTW
ncbi:MAG: hypothetical protein NZM11_12630 [Anaerolineales bacterium]|nr:hypothetical protein [Anaerolineales bacterium]